MAVVFGDEIDSQGWVFITRIQYNMDMHADGYSVEKGDIPKRPDPSMGIGYALWYHPEQDEWDIREMKVPFTDAESRLEIANAIRELAQAIKESR